MANKEGSWGQPGLQGKAVRGDQACRGRQLGAIRLAGEQLGINQEDRQVSSWEPAVLDCERDVQLPV